MRRSWRLSTGTDASWRRCGAPLAAMTAITARMLKSKNDREQIEKMFIRASHSYMQSLLLLCTSPLYVALVHTIHHLSHILL